MTSPAQGTAKIEESIKSSTSSVDQLPNQVSVTSVDIYYSNNEFEEEKSVGDCPVSLESWKRNRGCPPKTNDGEQVVGHDFKEGIVHYRRSFFRTLKDLTISEKEEVKKLLNNEDDFEEIMGWAMRATAPLNKVKDSKKKEAIEKVDSGEWNILRLVCYKYSKKVCVAFFRDPRLFRIFELFFQRILDQGHALCPNRKNNKKLVDPSLPKAPRNQRTPKKVEEGEEEMKEKAKLTQVNVEQLQYLR